MKILRYIIAMSMTYFLLSLNAFAAAPKIECGGLPGCDSGNVETEAKAYGVIGNIITEFIKYVAVIAVIAVMFGGIMYLISSGEEEKIKKAKNIIIWALVGVFTSVLAWSLINILNNFRI